MVAVIGVLSAFLAAIFVLNRWHNFGLAMLVSSALVALTGGFSVNQALSIFWQSATMRVTLELLLVVALINMLGFILKKAGTLEKIVQKMLIVLKDVRLLVITIPAIIGLLPVPGGAIMSAPLVVETGKKAGLSPERQAAANVLFRHLVYFVFPLYPTLILAGDVSGIPIMAFVKHQFWPMAVGLAVSIIVLFRLSDQREEREVTEDRWLDAFIHLIYYALPIIILLFLALVLQINFSIAAIVGILTALLSGIKSGEQFVARVKSYVLPSVDWNLSAAVLGIMVFRGYVEASGAMATLANQLESVGIPVLVLAVIVPLLTGIATGASLIGVGILFPLLLPLVPAGMDKVAFLSLIFISNMIGYMASPVHMCLALTREVCQARFGGMYPFLVPPLAAILITSVILAIV